MKNIELVKKGLYLLFNEFANNNLPDDEFVKRLQSLCAGKGNKSYWWRFFPGDTLANDAAGVQSSLSQTKNREHLKECIDIALTEKQMIVYYS